MNKGKIKTKTSQYPTEHISNTFLNKICCVKRETINPKTIPIVNLGIVAGFEGCSFYVFVFLVYACLFVCLCFVYVCLLFTFVSVRFGELGVSESTGGPNQFF